MKAYKATHNMKCCDFTYEVGKTYSISKLEICTTGFHYCSRMVDTLTYYNYHPINFILLEVEMLGNVETKGLGMISSQNRKKKEKEAVE